MENKRSLSIAVKGLFVSAFLSTVFGVANASAFTVTYKTYGGVFDDGTNTNIVEYDENKNIINGEYKEPTNIYSCGDKFFAKWFYDTDMKRQFYLRDESNNVTVYAGYNRGNMCFNYTGHEDLTFLKSGLYTLEVWGAQGGTTSDAIGGRGGYSIGKIQIDTDQFFYINVGEAGKYRASIYTYNGGGKPSASAGATGGGATHIALSSGLLSTLENDIDKILIVAGGGGGGRTGEYSNIHGGSGGGFKGNDADDGLTRYNGKGGTQTAGGTTNGVTNFVDGRTSAFGLGGNAEPGMEYLGGGGGAGFYGGGGGGYGHYVERASSGGGGSGYIGNPLLEDKHMVGYSVATSDDIETKTISTQNSSSEPISDYAKEGNGYAIINNNNFDNNLVMHEIIFKHEGEDDFIHYVIDGEKVVRPNIYLTADTGYTLHSWEINGTTTEWDFDDPVTEDLVLESYVSMDIYAISYNLGIGSLSEPNPATYTVESDDITLNNPNKDYYTFLGWSGTGLTGNRNKTVTIPQGSTGDRSYEANYSPIPYTITYNLDGGTNNANNPTAFTYESDEINIVAPTREGYTFTGWSGTDLTGEDNMAITIPVESHGNREYTAHWSINQYTATFDVNGGTSIDPTTITSNYGVAFGTLPTTSRTGYDFDGWYTEQTGGDKISDDTTMPAEDHAYYAHWTIQTFNISYDLNGGELAQGASNPDTYTYESADINLAKPSREGYTFLGWSGTDLTDNTEDVTIAHNSLGDRSYKAEFQINEYTATFDANAGETANPETITKNYNEELGNLPETSRLGYTFLGWFTDATAGDKITDTTKMPAGDVTYYAHWEIITYAIEYDLGGEDMDTPPANDSSNPTSYTVEDADITLKAATSGDTWHYFVGWALDRDSEDGLSDNFVIDTAEAKNIKVYAIFQANPYTVTLDPGNGDDEIVKTVRGDQEIGELPTPERAGYEFLGWFVGDKQIDEHFHPRSDSIAVARWEEIPTVPDTGANSTPNTGDAIMNHIVTFAVCALALFIVVALRKRKAKNEA